MPSAPLAVMPFDPAIVRPARAGIELKRTVRVSAISRRDVLKSLLIIQHKPTPRSGQQQWLVKNLPRGVIIKETETTPDSKLAEPQAMLRSPCIFLLGNSSVFLCRRPDGRDGLRPCHQLPTSSRYVFW